MLSCRLHAGTFSDCSTLPQNVIFALVLNEHFPELCKPYAVLFVLWKGIFSGKTSWSGIMYAAVVIVGVAYLCIFARLSRVNPLIWKTPARFLESAKGPYIIGQSDVCNDLWLYRHVFFTMTATNEYFLLLRFISIHNL